MNDNINHLNIQQKLLRPTWLHLITSLFIVVCLYYNFESKINHILNSEVLVAVVSETGLIPIYLHSHNQTHIKNVTDFKIIVNIKSKFRVNSLYFS